MKAAVYDTDGPDRGRLRVVELPDPSPAPGEVRVRIAVSGVNPTDWKARERTAGLPWSQQVPNQDGAGVVESVGDGVDPGRVGERVWVYHAAYQRPNGTAAELTCVPAAQAVPLPEGVELSHGAGLGIPAITAHRCLFADGPVDGRTVLVTGGAGAVGQAAVQLARWGGARVLATVSTAEKARVADEAGADTVLYYREPTFRDRLADSADGGIDRVVDVAVAANLASYLDRLSPHAVVSSYASDASPLTAEVGPLMYSNIVLRFVLVYGLPQPILDEAVTDITAALEGGALRPLPQHRFPLERADEAHEACRAGVTGKVLIDVARL